MENFEVISLSVFRPLLVFLRLKFSYRRHIFRLVTNEIPAHLIKQNLYVGVPNLNSNLFLLDERSERFLIL